MEGTGVCARGTGFCALDRAGSALGRCRLDLASGVWRGLLMTGVDNVRVAGRLLLGVARSSPLCSCMFWAFKRVEIGLR